MTTPTAKTHYLTETEIVERFMVEINKIDHLRINDLAKREYASSFARPIWTQAYNHAKNKAVTKELPAFDLKTKIATIVELLQENAHTFNPILLKILERCPSLIRFSAEVLASRFAIIIPLIHSHSDMFIPEKPIKTKMDIYHHLSTSSSGARLLAYSPETVSKFERYATLCKARKIVHKPFPAFKNGRMALCLDHMRIAELNKRLAGYDERVARSTAAAVATKSPAQLQERSSEEARAIAKAAMVKLMSLRAGKPQQGS